MIDTPKAAVAELTRRGLPAVFAAVWDGSLTQNPQITNYLRREWRTPDTYFEVCSELGAAIPELADLCPLYESNGESIVGHLPDGRFICCYYEDADPQSPTTPFTVLGNNYQQFVTSVLDAISDAGLWEQYGQDVASLLGYKYTKELLEVYRSWTDGDGPGKLARFRDSLV